MKKLMRSSSDRYLLGVCGGLAEYLNIDSTIVRLAWFFLSIFSFFTFGVIYLICGAVIPMDNINTNSESNRNSSAGGRLIMGLSLIIVGSFLLARLLFPWFPIYFRQALKYWPSLLIILGLYIIVKRKDD
ncbi:MAG: PspC domain-containing protein [Gudongella sp.]|nr:PspC domain-containing protein [Gudongella sp.]